MKRYLERRVEHYKNIRRRPVPSECDWILDQIIEDMEDLVEDWRDPPAEVEKCSRLARIVGLELSIDSEGFSISNLDSDWRSGNAWVAVFEGIKKQRQKEQSEISALAKDLSEFLSGKEVELKTDLAKRKIKIVLGRLNRFADQTGNESTTLEEEL